eukprot:6566315-Ditylum_brightwellii.AAC.1
MVVELLAVVPLDMGCPVGTLAGELEWLPAIYCAVVASFYLHRQPLGFLVLLDAEEARGI